MNIQKTDIIARIRTAIDDIVPGARDSFTADTDAELWQAVFHSVQSLLEEAPLSLLKPQSMLTYIGGDASRRVTNQDGSGYILMADDFLRFVSLRLAHWSRPVTTLTEPDSDEALRQSSRWGRGTPEKPRAMLDYDADGNLILRYWTAAKESSDYDHTLQALNYIPKAMVGNDTVTCAMKDEAERMVIYRAASIFFEGKKEPDTAEKFRNI